MWINAADLQEKEALRTLSGIPATVEKVHNFLGEAPMRDLTIAEVHTYYVIAGTTPVLVHNCGGAIVDPGKFDYMFGNVASNSHNAARSAQNQAQFARVGVYNNAEGRGLLQSHFDEVVGSDSNILRTFKNEHGEFQIRDSLFAGPGGFLHLETTWQVTGDRLRMTTVIPRGGR
ncbi:intein C-terminal splicing region [Micromonospora haikouensis]|uniref:Intein C-terminal splicing region n=1 Tax=Micromonospora haikouensis TaxID=686309 RepID=A0A1C4YU55_9ACTN|nr:intein C-terminal splicing region [Micromonospora haikouensis]